MTRHPHNGRARGHQSLAGSIGVGLAIVAMAFIWWVVLGGTASSHVGPCGPWKELREKLGSIYRESPVAGGIVSPQFVVMILASQDGTTFSIVTISSEGCACMVLTGTDWQHKPERGI